eukprot:3164511-Rhodomonas_salina.1
MSGRELTGLLSATSKGFLSMLEKVPQATSDSASKSKPASEKDPKSSPSLSDEEREAEMLDHVRGVL